MPHPAYTDHPFVAATTARIDALVGTFRSGDSLPGLVVGLSGGPDSVALLLAARAWADRNGAPLAAAHFNHRLRPGEAERDADFCRDLCRQLEITLFEAEGDPRPAARTRGQGLEEAARHLRRRFFQEILAKDGEYHCVATGHHRDDQLETVIMRLFRGTGPEGLRGILPVSGRTIHPLLQVPRSEILAFLEDFGQPWRTDATNLDGDNMRARIRREFLPLARGIFGPGADTAPTRMAELLQQDMDLLEKITTTTLAEVRLPGDAGAIGVTGLLALEDGLAARVLRRWLDEGNPPGLERVHVDNALAWLGSGQSGSGLDLPGGLRLERDFDRLWRRDTGTAAPPLRDAGDYRILVAKHAGGPEAPDGVGDPADEKTWQLTCPASALEGNLKVRNPEPGDRFQPFGLDGTKKLSDLLRERQVARSQRPGVLVVTDESGILWVVGLARAERTRLLPTAEQTVTISVAERTEHSK